MTNFNIHTSLTKHSKLKIGSPLISREVAYDGVFDEFLGHMKVNAYYMLLQQTKRYLSRLFESRTISALQE